MGTKVHCKSYLPRYFSMRDLNEDSSSSSWPEFYGGTNGHYFNGLASRTTINDYPGYDKNSVKQKMLEHETVFRNQVRELHRLYRIQRKMMEEVTRKDLNEQRAVIEHSLSSNFQGSRKWQMAGFSLENSDYAKTKIMGVEIVKSPMRNTVKTRESSQFASQNESSSNGCKVLDLRPLKVRKKFDLHLPAENFANAEEGEKLIDFKVSPKEVSASSSCLRNSTGLADLNEPLQIEESAAPSPLNIGFRAAINGESWGMSQSANSNPIYSNRNESLTAFPVETKKERLFQVSEAGFRRTKLNCSDQVQDNADFSRKNLDQAYRQFQSPVPPGFPGSHLNSLCFSSSLANSIGSSFILATELDRNSLPSAQNLELFNGKSPFNVICSENRECSTNQRFGIFPSGFDMNLNEAVSSNKPVILQDLNVIYEKSNPEDQLSLIPRPKSEVAHRIDGESSYPHASSGRFSVKNRTVRDLNQPVTPEAIPSLSKCPFIEERKANVTQNVKKILGFPISVDVHPKSEQDPKRSHVDIERKNGIIDINLECEPDEQMVEKRAKDGLFDLNSSLSDFEEPLPPSFERLKGSINDTMERNLEEFQDEALRDAAGVIFSISSSPWNFLEDSVCPSKASVVDSLLWLVDSISICAVQLECNSCEESKPGDEEDEFEKMTLQLPVGKEEDYMPKRIEVKPATNSLVSRPRRAQSRRGRHRRDFQRDILPGLTSLPRHEVIEDLQIFSGMMKAMGHNWNSSLIRRNSSKNGGGRGRRRTIIGPITTSIPTVVCSIPAGNKIEAGLEDRSLTGWGKTTRRPRRQRNNPSIITLT